MSGCNRRTFLGWCAASLGGVLAGCASLVARPVTPINGKIELAPQHYPELTQIGGAVRLQPVGSQEPVYVLVLESGEVAALSPICTHLGCTVQIQGPFLVCPCHGSTYDRDGEVLRGPAARSLSRYHVERAPDGVLVIDLQRRI
jgi:Rieske Fe-S protein